MSVDARKERFELVEVFDRPTVSYTHLDVYKRQAPDRQDLLGWEAGGLFLPCYRGQRL